jgi:hypothetical protein
MATAAPRPQPEAPPELRTENSTNPAQSRASHRHPTAEEIAREAYLIYQANGCQDGRDQDDWYEAEARLCEPPGSRQTASTPQQAAAQLEDIDTRDRTPG